MMLRTIAVLLSLLATLTVIAAEVGPEIPVTETAAALQQNAVISRASSRTLIAFEEIPADGQPSRVVLHQYEANLAVSRGRETFALPASARYQRRPALGPNMIAWVEEDADGGNATLWWQALDGYTVGASFRPVGTPERGENVAPGTPLEITNTHVFHILLWTAPDGRLKTMERSLIARIGYDLTPWYATNERAINPSAAGGWGTWAVTVAYNYEIEPGRYGVRATALWGRSPAPAVDIAPAGASAPRVVYNGIDYVVFWSMEDGATYGQRLSNSQGQVVRLGNAQKVADGVLHDVALGVNRDYNMVVDQGGRFALLRLGKELDVEESTPFQARLLPNERISLGSDQWTTPMLAYGSRTASRAVLRTVADVPPGAKKRRSAR